MTQEGKGGGYNSGRSNGAANSALAIAPAWRAGARPGSIGGREEQRAMCAVIHGNPATRCTRHVEVGVSTPPCRCYNTPALGSGQTTPRAAVSVGVHPSGAEGQHNGAHTGQTSPGGAMPGTGRPKMVRQRCRRAHAWPVLGGRGQCRPGMSSRGSVASPTSVSMCVCVCVCLVCLCCGGGGAPRSRIAELRLAGARLSGLSPDPCVRSVSAG